MTGRPARDPRRTTPPGLSRAVAGLALALAALSACAGDGGTLTGPSLAVDPCRGDSPAVFAPVDFTFDRLNWYRSADVATLQLRRGWRDPTGTDLVVLEISDLPALLALREDDPAGEFPLEGLARVAVVLRERCPDMVQPLEARTGTLHLDALDLRVGGRVVGTARFDLLDTRAPEGSAPAAENLVLDFHVDLSEKDPKTGQGRK